jgi:putative DNA methylase
MAIVAEGQRGRVYLDPIPDHEEAAQNAKPGWKPDLKVPTPCHDVDRLPMYGMPTWGDAFTSRQLVALNTFSDLVPEARNRVMRDALAEGHTGDPPPIGEENKVSTSIGDAISIYLGFAASKSADYWSNICT